MLHMRHIKELIERGEWFATIKLMDDYFHIPIRREH